MKNVFKALSYIIPIAVLSYCVWDIYDQACGYCEAYNDAVDRFENLVKMVEAGEDIIIPHTSEDDIPDPNLTLDNYLHKEG